MRYIPFNDQEETFGSGDEWVEGGYTDLLSAAYEAEMAAHEHEHEHEHGRADNYIRRTIHHYYPQFAGRIYYASGEAFRLTGRVTCELMATFAVRHTFEGVRGGRYKARYQRVAEEGEWVWVRVR